MNFIPTLEGYMQMLVKFHGLQRGADMSKKSSVVSGDSAQNAHNRNKLLTTSPSTSPMGIARLKAVKKLALFLQYQLHVILLHK
jgi:hypothetical protein